MHQFGRICVSEGRVGYSEPAGTIQPQRFIGMLSLVVSQFICVLGMYVFSSVNLCRITCDTMVVHFAVATMPILLGVPAQYGNIGVRRWGEDLPCTSLVHIHRATTEHILCCIVSQQHGFGSVDFIHHFCF